MPCFSGVVREKYRKLLGSFWASFWSSRKLLERRSDHTLRPSMASIVRGPQSGTKLESRCGNNLSANCLAPDCRCLDYVHAKRARVPGIAKCPQTRSACRNAQCLASLQLDRIPQRSVQPDLSEAIRDLRLELCKLRGREQLHRLKRLERQALLIVNPLALQAV
jgi:hypothetical protein